MRVGVNREPGMIDESGLSGPVKTYTLPPEENDRIFQDVKPHVPYAAPGMSKIRHHCEKLRSEEQENEDEIDPNEEINIEEIDRIESGAIDPAWGFDGCKW